MSDVERRHADSFADNFGNHLDGLIQAWKSKAEYDRQYEEFINNNQPPELPDQSGSLRDLYAYNRAKERYEEDLQLYERRRQDSARQFYGLAQNVLPMLPEGIPLIYDQQTEGRLQGGGKYEITHVVEDDASTIQIRQLDR
jgi:hypothetical protein